jgi:transposase
MWHTAAMTKHRHICLAGDKRSELEQLIKSGVRDVRVITRARVLLLLDRSQGRARSLRDVADAAMVGIGSVTNIKNRYFEGGLDRALHDLPRPGAAPKIDGEVEARLTTLVCSAPPDGYDRWTLRLLADELVSLELVDSISHVAVGAALKKTYSSHGK